MKLTDSYKLVSFNVVVVTTYKGVILLLQNLQTVCYKTYELKALDCQLKATSAFCV